MSIMRENEQKKPGQHNTYHSTDPTPKLDDIDRLRPSWSNTPHSDTHTPPNIDIPKIIEPRVPNSTPEPSLGHGYGYSHASSSPKKRACEPYQRAMQSNIRPSPPPSSPHYTHSSYRTFSPQATLGAGLDIRACLSALEDVASQSEAQHSLENQKHIWHVGSLGLTRKGGDNFGFSSASASRSVTPVGWPQGGITGHKGREARRARV